MKLVTFDTVNITDYKSGDPIIHFTRGGAITFSKYAVTLTKFAAGDKVAFHQDGENPEDWYISLSENGFTLREEPAKEGYLKFNSSVFAKMLLDSQNIEDNACGFCIGTEPTVDKKVEYWGLITLKPIIRTRKK